MWYNCGSLKQKNFQAPELPVPGQHQWYTGFTFCNQQRFITVCPDIIGRTKNVSITSYEIRRRSMIKIDIRYNATTLLLAPYCKYQLHHDRTMPIMLKKALHKYDPEELYTSSTGLTIRLRSDRHTETASERHVWIQIRKHSHSPTFVVIESDLLYKTDSYGNYDPFPQPLGQDMRIPFFLTDSALQFIGKFLTTFCTLLRLNK